MIINEIKFACQHYLLGSLYNVGVNGTSHYGRMTNEKKNVFFLHYLLKNKAPLYLHFFLVDKIS